MLHTSMCLRCRCETLQKYRDLLTVMGTTDGCHVCAEQQEAWPMLSDRTRYRALYHSRKGKATDQVFDSLSVIILNQTIQCILGRWVLTQGSCDNSSMQL